MGSFMHFELKFLKATKPFHIRIILYDFAKALFHFHATFMCWCTTHIQKVQFVGYFLYERNEEPTRPDQEAKGRNKAQK